MKKSLLGLLLISFVSLLNAQSVIFQPDVTGGLIGANAWTGIAQPTNPNDTQVVAKNNIGVKFIHNGHVLAINKTGLNSAVGKCLLIDFTLSIDSSLNSNAKAFTIELGDNLSDAGGADVTSDYAYFYISSGKNATSKAAKFYNGITTAQPTVAINTPIRIRWIVNNSSTSIHYTGPDGSINMIHANDWHLWADNSLLFTNQLVTQTNAVNSVRIQANASGVQTASFENFSIRSIINNTTLPIGVTHLVATSLAEKNRLSWNVFADKDMASIQVTRSKDGVHFVPLGNKLMIQKSIQYKYDDETPLIGKNYYQLETIYKTGQIIKSSIVLVDRERFKLKLYPNPVRVQLFVENVFGKIEIYNLAGIKILQKNATGNIAIDMRNLAKGIYFIKVNDEVVKFLKL